MTEIIDRPRILQPAMGRSEESQARYEAHMQQKRETGDTSCDLCRVAIMPSLSNKIGSGVLEIAQKHISLVENRFPYAIFDGQEVLDHHMLIPKEHFGEFKDFSPEAYMEYMGSLAIIMQGYDLTFTRSPSSKGSSIKNHLHTHAMRFGRLIDGLSYSKNDGISLVRYKGEDWLHPL